MHDRGHGRRLVGGVLVAVCIAAACSSGSDDSSAGGDGAGESEGSSTTAVDGPDGTWPVVDPADRDVDAALLDDARGYAFQDDRHTQGVVVAHRGAIVGEWYAEGADAESWTASWSVAKSFTSAAVGIALDEGVIPDVEEPLTTYFPDWVGTDRADITIRDVLHMASGLDWDEQYDPADVEGSEIIRMVTGESDQLAYAAGRPAEVEPGTRWSYSSGDTMLLSGVVEQATGMTLGEYAQEQIFDPIGMAQVEWWRGGDGHTLAYCCLDSTSRGLARFGQLYLQEGRWGDEQVVPEDWVQASLEPTAASEEAGSPYGYQWWLAAHEDLPDDLFMANGHDGQFIYVVRSLELVVVRNGEYVKHDGPPVADPTLFPVYPSDGLVEGQGTTPPASWDHVAFLGPIVDAVEGS